MAEAPKETIGDKARSFGRFIYNSDEGTVLGRGCKSWGKFSCFMIDEKTSWHLLHRDFCRLVVSNIFCIGNFPKPNH